MFYNVNLPFAYVYTPPPQTCVYTPPNSNSWKYHWREGETVWDEGRKHFKSMSSKTSNYNTLLLAPKSVRVAALSRHR